jgi:hypothetical protein
MKITAGPVKGLHRHLETSPDLGPHRSLSAMSSLSTTEKTPPGRRPALLYTFISFIALGGLIAFYGTSVFDFDSFSQSFSSPVPEQSLKPATTIIYNSVDTPITLVQEEFTPHQSSSVPGGFEHALTQPATVSPTIPSSTNTPIPPQASKSSTTNIDYTDPFNITRNVYYGSTPSNAVLIDRPLAGRNSQDSRGGRTIRNDLLLHQSRPNPLSSLLQNILPRPFPTKRPPRELHQDPNDESFPVRIRQCHSNLDH